MIKEYKIWSGNGLQESRMGGEPETESSHDSEISQERFHAACGTLGDLLENEGWQIDHASGGVFVLVRLRPDTELDKAIDEKAIEKIPSFVTEEQWGHMIQKIYKGLISTSRARVEQGKEPLRVKDISDLSDILLAINGLLG